MRFSDVVMYSAKSLQHRQGRFWLTIIGVIIGIAAVVALLTIGEAFNKQVEKELSSLSGNTVYIVPYSESAMSSGGFGGGTMPPSAGKLTDKDVERLKKIPELESITRLSERRVSVEYKGKAITTTVSGYEPGVFQKVTSLEIAEGRDLQDADRHVVQIGGEAAEKMFGTDKKVSVNSYLIINGEKYRVISILKKTGGGFGSDFDNGLFVHFEDSYELFKGTLKRGEMDAIAASVAEGADMDAVVVKIKSELDASHRVKEDERDYSVMDPKTIAQSVGAVLSLVTVFLGAIASISLIVGGLAISTAMFTSVIERTQEIGVLKAVGANDRDIMGIFLFEAGAVGAVGGVLGTALGLLVVYIASLFGLPAALNPNIALFGVLFAFVVGVLSGYFPARRAASLSPVEAFRYDK